MAMSQEVLETSCFLCECAKARRQGVDDENHQYVCDGQPPGEYRISNHAMRKLEQRPDLKAQHSRAAHQPRSQDEIYAINVDSATQEIIGRPAKKRPWP